MVHLMAIIFQVVINRRGLTMIFRILVQFLAHLIIQDHLLLHAILHFGLHFRRLGFINVHPFRITRLSSNLHAVLMPNRRVKVFFRRHQVILSDPEVVAHAITRRTPIRANRRIIQLRLRRGIRVLGHTIIVPRLYARRAAIVISSGVVPIRVRYRIVVQRHPSRIVLVMSYRHAISVRTHVARQRAGHLHRIHFYVLVFSTLRRRRAPQQPYVQVVTIRLSNLIHVIRDLRHVLLLRQRLHARRMHVHVAQESAGRHVRVHAYLHVFLLIRPTRDRIVPRASVLQVRLRNLTMVLGDPLVVLLTSA